MHSNWTMNQNQLNFHDRNQTQSWLQRIEYHFRNAAIWKLAVAYGCCVTLEILQELWLRFQCNNALLHSIPLWVRIAFRSQIVWSESKLSSNKKKKQSKVCRQYATSKIPAIIFNEWNWPPWISWAFPVFN